MNTFINLSLYSFIHIGGYWCNQNNQRAFFMLFARVNNFDPLLPESWYNISNKAIISMKVIKKERVRDRRENINNKI